jgi:hypothetical protein
MMKAAVYRGPRNMRVEQVRDLVCGSHRDVYIRTIYSPADDPTWRQSFAFPSRGRGGGTSTGTTSLDRNSLYFFTIGGHKNVF